MSFKVDKAFRAQLEALTVEAGPKTTWDLVEEIAGAFMSAMDMLEMNTILILGPTPDEKFMIGSTMLDRGDIKRCLRLALEQMQKTDAGKGPRRNGKGL